MTIAIDTPTTASVEPGIACREPGRPSIPESPTMRLYEAENAAALKYPAEPLDGSIEAAQAYVDRVTRSHRWNSLATGRLAASGSARKVMVEANHGNSGRAWHQPVVEWRGHLIWLIALGTKSSGRPAPIADPWFILHELAHLLPDGGRPHGREFARNLYQLVGRFLGDEAARELATQFKARNISYRQRRGAA